ncbi:hypothetical protein, partial [Streptomyces rubiginosohelvolus]
ADRLAHLGHIEHPVETYTIMRLTPNTMPVPDDADEWVAAFGRVLAPGNLPGGDAKTSTIKIIGTDPQSTATHWAPDWPSVICGERTERGCCTTPVGQPEPGCPNTLNHQGAERP